MKKHKAEFILKQVKQNDTGKIEMAFNLKFDDGSIEANGGTTYDRPPHPDFFMAMKQMDRFLADANKLRAHRTFDSDQKLEPALRKAWEEAEPILKKLDKIVYTSVISSGIAVKGDNGKRRVIITGKHNVFTTAVAMNSALISENGDSFGFEGEFFAAVDRFAEECRAFIQDKKSSQFAMDFKQGDAGLKDEDNAALPLDNKGELSQDDINKKIGDNIADESKKKADKKADKMKVA